MFRKRIIVIFLTLLLAGAGSVLYFNATPKDKLVKVLPNNGPKVDQQEFRRILDNLLETSITEGNRIELLKNGEVFYPRKLDAIAAAERSITMETYEFWGEEVAWDFAQALMERAEAGVKVHFIADYIGSVNADNGIWEKMEDAGVEVVRWRRPSWYQSGRFNHRTHRKLLVIDGKLGYTGGANTADPWKGSPETGGYRENHFELEGPIVGYLQASFLDNWLSATGELLLGEAYFPELEMKGDLEAQMVVSSPREGNKRIRLLFLLAIGSANEHLRIAAAYFYPDMQVKEALLAARERGVTIDILKPGEGGEDDWVRYASRNRWGDLLEAGVRIHEYHPVMYHAKSIMVDDQWTTIGSANFDNRSFRINDEANVNVFDAGFTRMMNEQFDADLETAELVTLESWQARTWRERMIGWLGNAIGPHL